ncbi:hypothetical protein GCM10020000_02150 [Streptomyces olivoverticillatus]
MADPVLDHELQPCGHQGVDGLGGDELVPGQQGAADLTGTRGEDLRFGLGKGMLRGTLRPKRERAMPIRGGS